MSTDQVVVATTAEDARAVDAVKNHHSELAGRIATLSEALLDAVATGSEVDAHRRALVDYLNGTLLPHATAEERALYPAAAGRSETKLLVESMIAVHRVLGDLVDRIGKQSDPVRAAASAYALRVVFDAHLADENDRILPFVAADPGVSLAGILHGMHELLDGHAEPEHDGHVCACGEHDHPGPVLDVREIPHAIRHATVFGAFDAVPDGGTLVLVAPHDPIPLLRQLTDRVDGQLGVDYEVRGPDAWRVRLTRIPVATSA